MITVCKTCGSALDEAMETCRDCGLPNPWCNQDPESVLLQNRRGGLFGSLIVLFRNGAHLERTLLSLAALDWFLVLIFVMILTATPWSAIPALTRMCYVGALVLGVGNLALALYSDLERPIWRALAQGSVALNLLGFGLLAVLDRAGVRACPNRVAAVYLELAVLVRALEGLTTAATLGAAPDRSSLWAGLFDLQDTLLGSTVDDLRALAA